MLTDSYFGKLTLKALEVNPVLQLLAGHVALDLTGHKSIASLSHAHDSATNVRSYDDARRSPQGMPLAPNTKLMHRNHGIRVASLCRVSVCTSRVLLA